MQPVEIKKWTISELIWKITVDQTAPHNRRRIGTANPIKIGNIEMKMSANESVDWDLPKNLLRVWSGDLLMYFCQEDESNIRLP